MSVTIALCVFAGAAALAGWVVAAQGRRWRTPRRLSRWRARRGAGDRALGFAVGRREGVCDCLPGAALRGLSCLRLGVEVNGASSWVRGWRSCSDSASCWSNALAYNEANLGPREQLAELEKVGETLEGEGPVLMTEYQPFGVRHFLREAEAEGASELRRRTVPLADGSTLANGGSARHGRLPGRRVRAVRSVVPRRSPEQSRPPGEYELSGPASTTKCGCARTA